MLEGRGKKTQIKGYGEGKQLFPALALSYLIKGLEESVQQLIITHQPDET